MKVRRFVTSLATLKEAGKNFVKSSSDVQTGYRATIVNLALNGLSKQELSNCSGESVGTINNWIKTADEKGFAALKRGSPPGRSSSLSEQQLSFIREAVLSPPSNYGFYVWDGKAVSELIAQHFDIKLGVRQCQKILKNKLELSLIRPRTFPSTGKDNEQEREDFKKKIIEVNKDPRKRVVFQDEAHFQQTTSVTRIWAAKGTKPEVPSAPGRRSVAISGYVFPDSGELIVTRPSWFNYETVIQSFRDFISMVNIPEDIKLVVVVDNAPWHKKACRLVFEEQLPEYEDIRKKMEVIKLPPYSPDLNPIEQCWRITRREVTHNRYFASVGDLDNSLFSYFEQYRLPNEKFRSLCSFDCFRA